ncbi:MAG: pantoate--beta-alanine ligase [Flavisolibacter sp.]
MTIFKNQNDLSPFLREQKQTGLRIGFVPTMGALHPGHISLISQARKDNDLVVCSIFINPTQFNSPEDFRLYPVSIAADIDMLLQAGCDILFLPATEEIYPFNYQVKQYALGNLEQILEGQFRPGHFQGVCQVVDRLVEIVNPTRMYLGQKDYQQCMVIHRLMELEKKQDNVQLVIAPTLREEDGLAMSSRNLRLNEAQRKIAPRIYEVLETIRSQVHLKPFAQLKKEGREQLEAGGFEVDYVEIADANTLLPAQPGNGIPVALVAASIGGIRLIDNLLLN